MRRRCPAACAKYAWYRQSKLCRYTCPNALMPSQLPDTELLTDLRISVGKDGTVLGCMKRKIPECEASQVTAAGLQAARCGKALACQLLQAMLPDLWRQTATAAEGDSLTCPPLAWGRRMKWQDANLPFAYTTIGRSKAMFEQGSYRLSTTRAVGTWLLGGNWFALSVPVRRLLGATMNLRIDGKDWLGLTLLKMSRPWYKNAYSPPYAQWQVLIGPAQKAQSELDRRCFDLVGGAALPDEAESWQSERLIELPRQAFPQKAAARGDYNN